MIFTMQETCLTKEYLLSMNKQLTTLLLIALLLNNCTNQEYIEFPESNGTPRRSEVYKPDLSKTYIGELLNDPEIAKSIEDIKQKEADNVSRFGQCYKNILKEI